MGKFLKEKKVVILLQGRHAGKKAVIVAHSDEGEGSRKYGHCVVAGIDKYPKKVTTKMSKKRVAKRSTLKAFVKVVNYNHIMPTRYSLDAAFDKSKVTKTALKDAATRIEAKNEIKKKFESKYVTGENRWFFSKLRF